MTAHYKLVLVLALQLGLFGASATQSIPAGEISKVSLHTTGGFAGVDEWRVVDAATPDSGQLFALVERADFQALATRYVPDNQCCDRFHYTVEVTGTSGRNKTVETIDGADAPGVLFEVITLTRRIGH